MLTSGTGHGPRSPGEITADGPRSPGEITSDGPRSPGEITSDGLRSPGPRSSKAEITAHLCTDGSQITFIIAQRQHAAKSHLTLVFYYESCLCYQNLWDVVS